MLGNVFTLILMNSNIDFHHLSAPLRHRRPENRSTNLRPRPKCLLKIPVEIQTKQLHIVIMKDETKPSEPFVNIHKIDDPDELDRVRLKGRGWTRRKYQVEMMRSRQAPLGPHSFVLVLDNLKAGFNVPKIIRTANAMGCREIHFVNIPMFDPTPAKGSLKHTQTKCFQTFHESYLALKNEGFTIFAMEPVGAQTLGTFEFPEKSALIVGHEEYGLSFDPNIYPDIRRLKIAQFGKVQSLNVSIAASLACFEYVRQHVLAKTLSPSSSKNL
jgi:tRNA G18 (ribose-2'-O)-methylase SpoU